MINWFDGCPAVKLCLGLLLLPGKARFPHTRCHLAKLAGLQRSQQVPQQAAASRADNMQRKGLLALLSAYAVLAVAVEGTSA